MTRSPTPIPSYACSPASAAGHLYTARAVGKAFLAAQSDDVALDYFQNVEKICHTQNTIIDQERFLNELRLIRAQGYSVDQEEFENGVGCVAAVIYKPDGIEGAISVSGPYTRLFANDVTAIGLSSDEGGTIDFREAGLQLDTISKNGVWLKVEEEEKRQPEEYMKYFEDWLFASDPEIGP